MHAPIYAGVWERQKDRDGTVVRTVSWPVKDGKQSMMAEGMLCGEVRIQDLPEEEQESQTDNCAQRNREESLGRWFGTRHHVQGRIHNYITGSIHLLAVILKSDENTVQVEQR